MNNERKYVITVTNTKGETRYCYRDREKMGVANLSDFSFTLFEQYDYLTMDEVEKILAEFLLLNDARGFPARLIHGASGVCYVMPKTNVRIVVNEVKLVPIETTYLDVAIKENEVKALKQKLIDEARANMTPEQREAVFG